MKIADVILGQLARIAVAIRRSGARSRLQKADHSFRAEEHKELEDHLKAIVLSRPAMLLAEYNKSEPDKVQRRLIRCNLRRRHRFIYAQHHAVKIEQVRPAPKSTEQVAIVSQNEGRHVLKSGDFTSQRTTYTPQANTKPIVSAQRAAGPPGTSEKTRTTVSAISESFALPQDPTPSQAAPTQASATATKVDYPWPPLEAQKGALLFQCPCCCQTFPAMMAKGNRWKYAHRRKKF